MILTCLATETTKRQKSVDFKNVRHILLQMIGGTDMPSNQHRKVGDHTEVVTL